MADSRPPRVSASFVDASAAALVLSAWRECGREAAISALAEVRTSSAHHGYGLLIAELQARLESDEGPRLLIDGLWFTRAYGGITRVWQQILSTWKLPGLLHEGAPVGLIDRGSCLPLTHAFPALEGSCFDPLDPKAVAAVTEENELHIFRWQADVFCSSWISSSGLERPVCKELALVHDCLPERFPPDQPELMALRRRWWQGASSHLAVSANTASDLAKLLRCPEDLIAWCHLAPAGVFAEMVAADGADALWQRLQQQADLPDSFVLLPATSVIGTYKNPELLAEALADSALAALPLLLCGIAAKERGQELEVRFPHLRGRIHVAGFSDQELALVYRHALAVVIPSRIEGFGLPAVEVMAAGGMPLIADSLGLREAGAEAALRFAPDQPGQLTNLLQLLLDPDTRSWLKTRIKPRVENRLDRLNPDLIGLALLAKARQVAA